MIKEIKKVVGTFNRLGQKVENFEAKYESQINFF